MSNPASQKLIYFKKETNSTKNTLLKSLNISLPDINKINDNSKNLYTGNNQILKDKFDGSIFKKFIAPLPHFSKSTILERKGKSVLAKREAEYDKNLKSIKINKGSVGNILMNKDNNKLKPLTGIIKNQLQNKKITSLLNRERSRSIIEKKEYSNLKTSPSDMNSSYVESETKVSPSGKNNDQKENNIFIGQSNSVINYPEYLTSQSIQPVGPQPGELNLNYSNKNFNKLLDSKKKEFMEIEEKITNATINLNLKVNESEKDDVIISNNDEMSSNNSNILNPSTKYKNKTVYNTYINKNSKILNTNNLNFTISNSLDLIINNTNDEDLLLHKDNNFDVEILLKDELVFNRCNSEIPEIQNEYSNRSKSSTSRVHIQHQYEYSIPLNNLSTLNDEISNSTNNNNNFFNKIINQKINLPTNFTNTNSVKPSLNFIQENINKINLGIFTANYENLRANKDSVAKFTQEEYRKLLTTYLRFEYGKNILDEFFLEEELNENFLNGHELTERMRTRMIDWMIEVLTNYKCDENTFFLSVNIMDRFFKNSVNKLKPDDLHLVGVCSMFIASKFYDVYPMKLKLIVEKVGHNKFSSDDIKRMEENIIKTLNYDLLKPTSFDFINFFFEEIFFFIENNFTITDDKLSEYFKYLFSSCGIEIKLDCFYEKFKNTIKFTKNMLNLLKHVVLYLAKMNCHDYSLIAIKPSLLAAASIFVGMKICEQINNEEYINDYILKRICEISRHREYDLLFYSQRILHNAQNFENIFMCLENLKNVHFNYILEIKDTK